VEIVNLRVTAIGHIAKPRLEEIPVDPTSLDQALKENRQVHFPENGGFTPCPVYDRYGLGAGTTVPGPAVVEETNSTTVIHPGYRAMVDRWGNLIIVKT
jgi:N-methylhydantoinase A